MSKLLLILLASVLLNANPALADIFEGLDVSAGSGVIIGKVSATESDGTSREFSTGGIPFVAFLNRDLSAHWTGSLQAQVLLDTVNQQMIRQGFAGSTAYHILGGARRIVSVSDVARNVSTSNSNLSFVVRGGIFSYAASEREDPEARLSGSVWEMASGLEYRRSISDSTAFGASALSTVITLPASVDRLSARMIEILGFWRTYL